MLRKKNYNLFLYYKMNNFYCCFCQASIVSKYYFINHLNTRKCITAQNRIIQENNLEIKEINLMNHERKRTCILKKITNKEKPFLVFFD